MKVKLILAITAILTISAANTTFAQHKERGCHKQNDPEKIIKLKVEMLSQELSLTADQATKMTEVFKQEYKHNQKLKESYINQLKKRDKKIEKILTKEQRDQLLVNQELQQVKNPCEAIKIKCPKCEHQRTKPQIQFHENPKYRDLKE